jgi:hypothetical protein
MDKARELLQSECHAAGVRMPVDNPLYAPAIRAIEAALTPPEAVRDAVEALEAAEELYQQGIIEASKNGLYQRTNDLRSKALASLRSRVPTPAPDAVAGWLPIDSAPKDGSHVLLARAGEWSSYGYYEAELDGWWEANTHWTDATDGQCYPTHWQPLPSPPLPLESDNAGEVG